MDTLFLVQPLDYFHKLSQEIITNIYYLEKTNNTDIDPDVVENAKHEMRTIMSESNFDVQKVTDFFKNKQWDQERVTYFMNLMKNNWSELLGAALNHFNSGYGETVINFDWIVKYILGTSELKPLKYPLLQLVMSTVNKVGLQNRIMYDVNKDMLLKIINVLENV